jgi:nucleotide-binding universal stress UspA family protein
MRRSRRRAARIALFRERHRRRCAVAQRLRCVVPRGGSIRLCEPAESRLADLLHLDWTMSSPVTIQHILVAHDFSPNADEALQHALNIGAVYGACVTVVHAYDVSALGYPDTYFPSFSDFAAEIERASKEEMEKVASRFCDSSIKIDTAVIPGAPAQELVAFASQVNVDLIVMGTHGRKGLSHLLLGSVAETISLMRKHADEVRTGLEVVEVARSLRRIAEHAIDVAEEVIFIVSGNDVRHERRQARLERTVNATSP